MLEERIDVLIQSIDVLNVHLQRLWDAKDEIKGVSAPEISGAGTPLIASFASHILLMTAVRASID